MITIPNLRDVYEDGHDGDFGRLVSRLEDGINELGTLIDDLAALDYDPAILAKLAAVMDTMTADFEKADAEADKVRQAAEEGLQAQRCEADAMLRDSYYW